MRDSLRLLSAVVGCLGLLLVKGANAAGLNANGHANLSWSSNSIVSDLTPTGGNRRLYVRIDSVASVQAVDIMVVWTPSGESDSLYELSGWAAPSGANCTWTLKGSVTSIPATTDSSLRLTATGSSVNTTCNSGNAIYLDFSNPSGAGFETGRFRLAFVRVLDANGDQDELELGGAATILGGSVEPAPVFTSQFPHTGWSDVTDRIEIKGFNFRDSVTAALIKPGASSLQGTVERRSDRLLEVTFTYALADTGERSLVLVNPGGRGVVSPAPTRIVESIDPGAALSGSPQHVLVHLSDSRLPLTGPGPVRLDAVRGGDTAFRDGLVALGVRTVQCLWPGSDLPPRSVRDRSGVEHQLFDFSRSYELTFDSPEAAENAQRTLSVASGVITASLSPATRTAQCEMPNVPSCGQVYRPTPAQEPDFFDTPTSFGQWYLHQDADLPDDEVRWNEDMQATCGWVNPKARGNRSVVVAILDSGVDATHADLNYTYSQSGWGQKVLPGYNAITGTNVTTDIFGHGTFVAGLVAARTANGTSYTIQGIPHGMAGVAGGWQASEGAGTGPDSAGARILPVKVIGDNGAGTLGPLVAGINWAVTNGADIINLSLALPALEGLVPYAVDVSLRNALANAMAQGVTVITAMGNKNNTVAQYPARYAEWGLCVAVGGSDECGFRYNIFGSSTGSSYGPHMDFLAPAHAIFSTAPVGGSSLFGASHYAESMFGTSYAAALASGVAASLKGLNPALDDVDIKQILRETADASSMQFPIEMGKGRLDHGAAVRLIDPSSVNRGAVIGAILDAHTTAAPQNMGNFEFRGSAHITDGVYANVERRELRFTTTFSPTFNSTPKAWVRVGSTRGWSGGSSPHLFDYGAGDVVSVNLTGAEFRTYVYYVPSLNRWLPTHPDSAVLDFRAAGQLGGVTAVEPLSPHGNPGIVVYGNPTSLRRSLKFRIADMSSGQVRVEIMNVSGRVIWRERRLAPEYGLWEVDLSAISDLSPGVYFVHVESEGSVAAGRFVVLP